MFAFLVIYRSRLRNIFIIRTTHLKINATLGQDVKIISGEVLIGSIISEIACAANSKVNAEREYCITKIEIDYD